jgi:cation transport ATPase
VEIPQPETFSSEAGLGVRAQINGKTIFAGSAEWLEKSMAAPANAAATHDAKTARDATSPDAKSGTAAYFDPKSGTAAHFDPKSGTAAYFAAIPRDAAATGTAVHIAMLDNGSPRWLGSILLNDQLKEESAAAVKALHAMTLRVLMVTGDTQAAADIVAKAVGIDEVRAGVKPAEKERIVRELQKAGAVVAMVGDGINDAPALAAAELGIAIGSGSDVAKETGGIVLVGGSLQGVAVAIRLSRATMRTIRQNLFLAFIYNVLAIPLAAMGLLNPLVAAAAMALSDVTVIGNALRLRYKRLD